MFWLYLIVVVILALNALFLAVVIVAGWLRGRRPLTQQEIERQAQEDREQLEALDRQAAVSRAKRSKGVRA